MDWFLYDNDLHHERVNKTYQKNRLTQIYSKTILKNNLFNQNRLSRFNFVTKYTMGGILSVTLADIHMIQ